MQRLPFKREEIEKILSLIEYKDWEFRLLDKGDGYNFQFRFYTPDNNNPQGKKELQSCRKWYLSPYSTKSEVVRTVFKAVQAAEEHELCERFRYKGIQPFNPHLDIEDITTLIKEGKIKEDAR